MKPTAAEALAYSERALAAARRQSAEVRRVAASLRAAVEEASKHPDGRELHNQC